MNELFEKYPAVLDVATVAEILGVTLATVPINYMVAEINPNKVRCFFNRSCYLPIQL